MIEPAVAYWIANRVGIQVPNPRLVELFMNDDSHGIVIETPHLNEGYLRKNGFMPVNLYKLDRDLDKISNDTGLGMQNIKRWTKLATNNRYQADNRQLLERFLNNYNKSLHDAGYLEKLRRTAPYDIWVKYLVFDILANNFHSGRGNVRVIADDQSGHLVPIAWDPKLVVEQFGDIDRREHGADSLRHAQKDSDGSPNIRLKSRLVLANCEMPITCLYLRNSDFRLHVMKLLYRYLFDDTVLSKANSHIDNLRGAFETSLKRDINRLDLISDIMLFMELAFDPSPTMKRIDGIQRGLRNYEAALKRTLSSQPEAAWSARSNRLSIFVDGPVPLADVHITTGQFPASVVYDANNSGTIDEADIPIPFESTSDGIALKATWLSNIFRFQKSVNMKLGNSSSFANTRHDVLFSRPLEIGAVFGFNALSNMRVELPRQQAARAAPPDKRNVPVTPQDRKLQILQGIIHIRENTVFDADVLIMPGARFLINGGASLVFRGRLETRDEPDNPVIFASRDGEPFGTVAIQGAASAGSILQNARLSNGSGGIVDGVNYLSMLSVNDTADVTLKNVVIENNQRQDDMLHIVYGNKITLENLTLKNARSDAIDIDVSHVDITNLRILHAGNDCVDLMQASVTVSHSHFEFCGDKGLSVGEKSELFLINSTVDNSKIGLQAKDGSYVSVVHADFVNNATQFSLFNKNWRYGNAGSVVEIDKSFIDAETNKFDVKDRSRIVIHDSTIVNGPTQMKGVEFHQNNDFTETRNLQSLGQPLNDKTLPKFNLKTGIFHQRGTNGIPVQ